MAEATARRLRLGAVLPALVGLVAAAYLTVEHYSGSTSLACPDSGSINCVKVTTSSYSSIVGIPVALLGLLYFVAMLALVTPWAWSVPALRPVRLAGGVAGVAFVLYLVWAELFRIDAICLWCTAVHLATIVLFAAVVWYSTDTPGPDD